MINYKINRLSLLEQKMNRDTKDEGAAGLNRKSFATKEQRLQGKAGTEVE